MSQVRICSWVDLSLTDVERLLDASHSTESLQKVLSEILGEFSSKQGLIELDLYTYAVLFAKNKSFSAEQLSAFFTILKSVHLMCISTPFDNFQDTFQYFKQLLLRHSVNRPPYSTNLYSIAQVRDISEYVLKTYFKHFKLYKYAFTKRVQMSIRMSYSGVPDTPEPSQTDITETVCVEETEEKSREEEETEVKEEVAAKVRDEEEEQQTLSPEQQHLQQMIASSLNEKMKELQVAVDRELTDHDKRLSERISALESTIEGKGKGKKGK